MQVSTSWSRRRTRPTSSSRYRWRATRGAAIAFGSACSRREDVSSRTKRRCVPWRIFWRGWRMLLRLLKDLFGGAAARAREETRQQAAREQVGDGLAARQHETDMLQAHAR